MPETRSLGLLVSPMGHAEALTKDEYAQLKLIRGILNEDTGLRAAFRWLLHLADKPEERRMDDAAVLKRIADHYFSDNADDSDGILLKRFTEPGIGDLLSERELEVLSHTLITLRLGGWFSGWLACQVGTVANAKVEMPDDQYPSPLKIAGALGLDLVEWQDELDAAKRVAARRPDLLFPVMRCEGDDPELVLETPPPDDPAITKAKPKPRRARKGGRKAA